VPAQATSLISKLPLAAGDGETPAVGDGVFVGDDAGVAEGIAVMLGAPGLPKIGRPEASCAVPAAEDVRQLAGTSLSAIRAILARGLASPAGHEPPCWLAVSTVRPESSTRVRRSPAFESPPV